MSTLENKQQKARKIAFRYGMITIFCACFGFIYEQFSFGVYSNYMMFFFLFPLIGGVVPFVLAAMCPKIPLMDSWCLVFYHSGIAALTVGSCVTGILEIYGTSSSLVLWYPRIGIFLFALIIIRLLLLDWEN